MALNCPAPSPTPPVVKEPHYLFVSKQSVYTLNLYVCVSDFIVVSICETKPMCYYELCKFLSFKTITSFDCYLEEFHLKKKIVLEGDLCATIHL